MAQLTTNGKTKRIASAAIEELDGEISGFDPQWPGDEHDPEGYADHRSMVAGMIDSAYATGRVSSYSPKIMAGAAIYAAGLLINQKVGRKEVASVVGCSQHSISSHYENFIHLVSEREAVDGGGPTNNSMKKNWANPRQK